MKKMSVLVIAMACLALSLECNAQDKDAAKVSVTVVSDGKIKDFNLEDHKDKVVVVEFWATWCPPCRRSIPHLGKLQKEFGDKVVILGISNEKLSTVKKFYKKMKDKMTYTVAIDKNGATSKGYMKAYNVRGIPHAFIVKGGKVIWHGHPAAIEVPLKKALEGTGGDKKFMDLDVELK